MPGWSGRRPTAGPGRPATRRCSPGCTTEVWSFLAAYQRYHLCPLRGAEAGRYLDEMAVVAERLGAAEVPRSRAQGEVYLDRVRPSWPPATRRWTPWPS